MPNVRPLLAVALLTFAAPLAAQTPLGNVTSSFDSKAPIDVDADRIEVLGQQNQAVFSGHVRVRQGNLTILADRITISYRNRDNADPVVERLLADGHVRIVTQSEQANARYGIYDVDQRLLTLIGDVVLTQGTTKVQGNRLVIDVGSGRSTLDGKTAGGGDGARVSGRFAVPEKKN